MAGIGFQLDRMARQGGLGGIASAAVHGAVISSGPWLLTIGVVLALQQWTGAYLDAPSHATVQTILVYAFSASTAIAAPIAMIATRMASDRIFLADRDSVPDIMLAGLTWVTLFSLLASTVIFGFFAAFPPALFLLATALLTFLAQIWTVSPFLTATRRHQSVLMAYLTGTAAAALPILLLGPVTTAAVLTAVAGGLIATLCLLVAAIRSDFPTPSSWPDEWNRKMRNFALLGVAGLANALAIWIDKWILWWGPGSIQAVSGMRLNPINDQASFLGLLTMVPGLTLVLITTETRFDRAFANLLARCTGTSNRRRIEKGRRDLARTILLNFRLLIAAQTVLASFCWVLAPEILRLLGMDARAIFGFRQTVIGVVFHLVAIEATSILAYYDLFGRILAVWGLFALVSAAGTIAYWDAGFAGFGWGYLAGAVAAASLALALVLEATSRLTYLLFVGNNPAIVGVRNGL